MHHTPFHHFPTAIGIVVGADLCVRPISRWQSTIFISHPDFTAHEFGEQVVTEFFKGADLQIT